MARLLRYSLRAMFLKQKLQTLKIAKGTRKAGFMAADSSVTVRPGFDSQQGLNFSPCNHDQTTCLVKHAPYTKMGDYFPVGKVFDPSI